MTIKLKRESKPNEISMRSEGLKCIEYKLPIKEIDKTVLFQPTKQLFDLML